MECIGGIIPDFTPFQLFKMVWSRMKNNDSDISFFNSWFPLYKTSEFDERISSASVLSGSNIIARYLNISDKKYNDKEKKVNMKCRKTDRIEKIRNLKPVSQLTAEESVSLVFEDALQFFISNNYSIDLNFKKEDLNESDIDDYLKYHYKLGIQKINEWVSTH